jgi:Family of unknown function (DUF6101)
MVLGGAMPVGSGRAQRLDPLALPVRFTATDVGADERVRDVELTCERVVLRRAVRGIRMAVNLPVTAFLGVALRLVPSAGGAPDLVTVSLEHRDAGLTVPLFSASDSNDVVAEWQLWAKVLKLPLLVAHGDGSLTEPFDRLGLVRVASPEPRRRRKNAVKARHPAIMLRRYPGTLPVQPIVHRGEREIIARN